MCPSVSSAFVLFENASQPCKPMFFDVSSSYVFSSFRVVPVFLLFPFFASLFFPPSHFSRSEVAPRDTKTAPRGPPEAPRRPEDASKRLPEGPKRPSGNLQKATRRPKTAPRDTKTAPRAPQRPQERPTRPQEDTKGHQEDPKSPRQPPKEQLFKSNSPKKLARLRASTRRIQHWGAAVVAERLQ